MAFKGIGSVAAHQAPVLKKVIIGNSVALVEEDSVRAISGFCVLNTAGSAVLGHVRGIVDERGSGMETDGTAGAATGSFTNAFTAASDNQTVAKVSALVDISKHSLYSADPDATIATTTGSNLLGYHTDIADEDNTDEDTATLATAQYTIWGVDPADSGNQIVSIYESQVLGL